MQGRTGQQARSKSRTRRRWLPAILLAAGAIFLLTCAFYANIAFGLKSPDSIVYGSGNLQILDRNGQVLFQFAGDGGGFRTPVRLANISPNMVNATVATEDPNYWHNPGLDLRGIGRAVYENLAFWKNGGFFKGSGGSSITQQLAKNLYFPPNERSSRSLDRKAREAVIALELNRRYSKQQILEWYLNETFYGNGAYGVEAASQRYFGKSAKDLSLPEAALLAGIPSAPAAYDPIAHPDAAMAREKEILDLMAKHHAISEEDAQAAIAQGVQLHPSQLSVQAPHFASYVRDLLPKLIGKDKAQGDLKVVTSLDLGLQRKAEDVVRKDSASFASTYGASNAALVAMDPKTGEILAMVGSPDYFGASISGEVNNATALNQPGSSFKPITYLAAFIKGWSPATPVNDAPITLNDGKQNFTLGNADGRYRGVIPVREALGSSLNVPAVKALQYAGLDNVHALARKMGITTLKDPSAYGPSFTLGGADVTLLDLTYAYTVFAGYGQQAGIPSVLGLPKGSRALDPVAVLRVEDAHGNIVWQAKEQTQTVVAPGPTYLVTSILSDNNARVSMFGANSALQIPGRTAAVKTGLSDNARDAWSIGYTPSLVAGVWVGNADNTPMQGATSGTTAAPLWRDFMEAALEGKPDEPFNPPDDVRFVRVCEPTGGSGAGCGQVVTDVFLASNMPTSGAFTGIGAQAPVPQPTPAPRTPAYTVPQAPAPQPLAPQPAPRQGPTKRGKGH